LGDDNFLRPEGVVGADLLTVEDLTRLFADISLGAAELLACCCVYLSVHRLLGWHDRVEEG